MSFSIPEDPLLEVLLLNTCKYSHQRLKDLLIEDHKVFSWESISALTSIVAEDVLVEPQCSHTRTIRTSQNRENPSCRTSLYTLSVPQVFQKFSNFNVLF